MNIIDKTKTIGQLVTSYPYITDVLNKYKIDYSYNGNIPLEEILANQNLSEYDVVGELDIAVDEFKLLNEEVIYWENEPITKIVYYIEENHHKFMISTLNEIDKLLKGSFENEPAEYVSLLLNLRSLFRKLKTDIESHQEKEEENLFPLLRKYDADRTKEMRDAIIRDMTETENEHDFMGKLFKEINELTDNYSLFDYISPSLSKIYSLFETLEKDTFKHMHMENSILFKMI